MKKIFPQIVSFIIYFTLFESFLATRSSNSFFPKINEPNEKELKSAIDDLYASGSIEYAKKRAMYHHSIAHECLNNLKNSPEVDVLRELTDFQLIRIN